MHDEGICVDYECSVETTETENCNLRENNFCLGNTIIYGDYICSNEELFGPLCVISNTVIVEECDDGLYCNGQETCEDIGEDVFCQAGTPVDCSSNNLESIETCFNDPDANPFTWDYFAGFTSTCNEETDSCETGEIVVDSSCDVENCDAECDDTHSCEDTSCTDLSGCVGNDYYEYLYFC